LPDKLPVTAPAFLRRALQAPSPVIAGSAQAEWAAAHRERNRSKATKPNPKAAPKAKAKANPKAASSSKPSSKAASSSKLASTYTGGCLSAATRKKFLADGGGNDAWEAHRAAVISSMSVNEQKRRKFFVWP